MATTRPTRNVDSEDEIPEIPNLDAAVAHALHNMFPGLTTPEMLTQVINNIRNQAGTSGSGGGA